MAKKNDSAAGCGCLLVVVLVIAGISKACSGSDDAPAVTTARAPAYTTPAYPTYSPPAYAYGSGSAYGYSSTTTTTTTPPYLDVDDQDLPNHVPDVPTAQRQAAVDTGGGGAAYYKNCTAARAAGAAPILRGEPGYRSALDRDNDGIACE